MSLKTGCYQDLSIGGLTVVIMTHAEFIELRDRCCYTSIGIHSTSPYCAPKDEPMEKWCALNQSQEARYLDKRME